MSKFPAYQKFRPLLTQMTGLARLFEEARWSKIHSINLERLIREDIARVLKIKPKEVEREQVIEGFIQLIELALKDPWMKPRLDSIAILYRNFGRLIK